MKGKTISVREDLDEKSQEYYRKFRQAKSIESLDIMADGAERKNRADHWHICAAYEVRYRDIKGARQ